MSFEAKTQGNGGQQVVCPELLAPAGNMEMMRAAVENGADAIYFGLEWLNARLRAGNFREQELGEVMAWLHERGVRGYVTLNTLVFASEMEEAARLLRVCSDAGVDAVLVQDLGLAALAARMVPELPVHASTQMTLTCGESVEAARELGLGIDRVIVPREANLQDVRRISSQVSPQVETEVFVHGALCVAYSGQCLTSEALGGRSANRGECAQACRLPYDLVVDGEKQDMGDVRYLLSPRDLAAYEDLRELVQAGVKSLKIEGRLKSPAYVAATVGAYRKALDEIAGREGMAASPKMDDLTRQQLAMTFTRGFCGGYLHATDHQAVVEGRYPKKRGLYLGRVLSVSPRSIEVELVDVLKLGDGVVFDAGRPEAAEQGGRIYGLRVSEPRRRELREVRSVEATPKRPVEAFLAFGEGSLDPRRIKPGERLWKTSDPEVERQLASSFAEGRIGRRAKVRALVSGRPGEELALLLEDMEGNSVLVCDTLPAEPATKRPLTHETLQNQLGRLGDTPFELAELEAALEGDLMVPFSRLNDLRRRAAELLISMRRASKRGRKCHAEVLNEMRNAAKGARREAAAANNELSVLCRTLEQVEAASGFGDISTVYVDFEDLRELRVARQLVKDAGQRFVPATLRVVKPGEQGVLRKLAESSPDALLVRNLASWRLLRRLYPEVPLLGDYALNVANDLSAALLRESGFERLTPSYDLNVDQLLDLFAHAPAEWFEVVIHQHLPMFHMEHCVFCRFLSSGNNYTNCGRPCENHEVGLRDRLGYCHPVKADAGCRNTVYNAVPQSASEYLELLRKAGCRAFRIEFLEEDAQTVREIIGAYAGALRGESDGAKLWRKLRASSKLGVTRGSLDHE